MSSNQSIYKEYFTPKPLTDRFLTDAENGIEVIIPVFHTNELWYVNLISIYREVPVKRLLISDGGVIDNSLEIVKQFPRVEIFNHREFKTLGKCIAELIKEVKTEHFIYLHSDVYLPEGWFDKMIPFKSKYDWFGCPMRITILTSFDLVEPRRPYAGSQIGAKKAFMAGIDKIDDDYVYRQEDFVFDKIVTDAGFKSGKVEDIFHYHQIMYRESKGMDLKVKSVAIETNTNEWEKKRAMEMQIRGIVKYLDPIEPFVIDDYKFQLSEMIAKYELDFNEFKSWVETINPKWLPYTVDKVQPLKISFMKKVRYKLIELLKD